MKPFDISTDSTCDLYANEIAENGLFFLPLTYTLQEGNGEVEEHLDNFQSAEEYEQYYDILKRNVISRTSMNNPFIHEQHFLKMAEAGVTDAIHFTISYGLCHTVDVARAAVEVVKKQYPAFNCLCVECNTTTVGQGFLVNVAINMRKEGKSLQETFDYVEKIKHKIQHFIIVDNLASLVRGGRISAAAGAVGTLLNVKPIIVFNKEGKLQKYKQVSGMRHAVHTIVKEYANYTPDENHPTLYIGHTGNKEMCAYLKELLEKTYNVNVVTRMIGPVIASHLGPNAVAYIFVSKEDRPI